MHSKYIPAVLCIGCFALSACAYVSVNNGIYRSGVLSFSMEFPSGWYLPEVNDSDPHFYETRECAIQANTICAAFEVQNQDSEFDKGPDAVFQAASSAGLKPEKLSMLIPHAMVIESSPSGPAEGWRYEYYIFFFQEKQKFLIFSNDRELENSIFPTMKSTK